MADNKTLLCSCDIPGRSVSTNRIWRHGQGRTYKSKETREFEELATSLMKQAQRLPTWNGNACIYIEVWREKKYRYDLDNRIKLIQDCTQKAGIIKDDAQISEVHAVKCIGEDEHIHVELYAVPEIDARPQKRKSKGE